MKTFLIILLGLGFGLGACTAEVTSESNLETIKTIRVRLSPLLLNWKGAFEESCARWSNLLRPKARLLFEVSEEARGEKFFDLTIDIAPARQGVVAPDSKTIAFMDARDETMVTTLDESATRLLRAAVIFIFRDGRNEEVRLWIALHEIGHALGLRHDTDKTHKSIMWPSVSQPIKLGCEDWQQLCAIWGCDARCEGQAWL